MIQQGPIQETRSFNRFGPRADRFKDDTKNATCERLLAAVALVYRVLTSRQ